MTVQLPFLMYHRVKPTTGLAVPEEPVWHITVKILAGVIHSRSGRFEWCPPRKDPNAPPLQAQAQDNTRMIIPPGTSATRTSGRGGLPAADCCHASAAPPVFCDLAYTGGQPACWCTDPLRGVALRLILVEY